MTRAKTVTVTVRLPVGIVAILDDAVKRGMFTSTSDAIRSLVGRTLQVTSQDAVGGPIRGMEIGSTCEEPPSTTNEKTTEQANSIQNGSEAQEAPIGD